MSFIRGVLRLPATVLPAVALTACVAARPATLPAASAGSASARLEAADRLVDAGCLDCLVAAYREFSLLRTERSLADTALAGMVRAAALIDIRERELGLPTSDFLSIARTEAQRVPAVNGMFATLLEIVAELRVGPEGFRPSTDAQVAAMLRFATNRLQWASLLRESAPRERLAGYVWVAFACDSLNGRSIDPREARSILGDGRETPLLTFAYLAACERGGSDSLTTLLDREPRFVEANYLIGLAALRQRPQPDVDAADRRFQRAFEWHQDWPSLTLSIANLALATEDYDRAFQFYGRTLALKPADPDALVGTIRALTNLGRYAEALDTVEVLLGTGMNLGEARYWRAFNENQIGRYEAAWADVQMAASLLVNAQVPKLAGIVAYRKGDVDVARRQLEDARTRNPVDCEAGFYLHMALADRRDWGRTADVASEAARCFDNWEARLKEEVLTLGSSNGEPSRVARQIARREEQIATNSRMRVAAWFNTAVAMFNLGRHSEARIFATKLLDDEQFGDRARALLPRLRP